MQWQEYYKSRRVEPAEAAALVKPGMRVQFQLAAGGVMQRALAARAQDLLGPIDLRLSSPTVDPGWLDGSLDNLFRIEFEIFIVIWAALLTIVATPPIFPISSRPASRRMISGHKSANR